MTYISAWWMSLPNWAKGALPLLLLVLVAGVLVYAMGAGLDVMVFFRWLGELVGRGA